MQLRANGHTVYGFGERKTPSPFVNACSEFLFLDSLSDPSAVPVAEQARKEAKPTVKSRTATSSVQSEETTANGVDSVGPRNAAKPLSQDTRLVTILRGAVEASARDDGWAAMSAAGSAAKRQAPIDPRNYGVKNFPALFEATGLFEITKGEGGHSYVADKRNRDRLPRPNRP